MVIILIARDNQSINNKTVAVVCSLIHLLKYLRLIEPKDNHRFHLRMSDLQVCCCDLIQR